MKKESHMQVFGVGIGIGFCSRHFDTNPDPDGSGVTVPPTKDC
jgi:hypothetical protein